MEQLVEFITNHWMLSSAFVATLALFAISEARKGGAKVSPHEATLLINKQDAAVVDIRQKKEFKTGYITGAINIPLAELSKRIGELEKYRDRPVIIVCNLGHTAAGAVKILTDAKFNQVLKLAGGITEWKAQNLPIVKK